MDGRECLRSMGRASRALGNRARSTARDFMPAEHQGQRATSVCGYTQDDESGSTSARARDANRKRLGTRAMGISVNPPELAGVPTYTLAALRPATIVRLISTTTP